MIKYYVVSRKNPLNEDVKWYAQAATPEVVTIEQLGADIAQMCTITEPDILAVLKALQIQMKAHLQNGRSVRLGIIGSFRPTLHSVGAPTEEAFSVGNINRISLQWVPDSTLRKSVAIGAPGLSLKQIPAPPEPTPPQVVPGA